MPGCPPSQLSEKITKKAPQELQLVQTCCSPRQASGAACKTATTISAHFLCALGKKKHPPTSLKIYMTAPCSTSDCLPDITGTGSCYQLIRLQHQSLGCWVYAEGKALSFHPRIHTPNGAAEPESIKRLHINILLRKLVTRLEEYF